MNWWTPPRARPVLPICRSWGDSPVHRPIEETTDGWLFSIVWSIFNIRIAMFAAAIFQYVCIANYKANHRLR